MRKAFVATLIALAAEDERIVLLTADLGYNALEPFVAKFPARFYNVGAAEQNLIALATGLADAGLIPYCYSIASFAVLRTYEFIRNGPILHRLPVRIVGMGGGFDYATNGLSHYGIDDLGAMRVQPGVSIFAPADSAQTQTILRETAGLSGPIYYRLEKNDSLLVPELNGQFAIGRPEHLVVGHDLLFVTTGSIAVEAIAAARELIATHHVSAGVAIMSSLNPIDHACYADLLRGYRSVISVEAHYINGAVGSVTAETIAEEALPVRLMRKGVVALPDGITGSVACMQERNGLSRVQLVSAALASLGRAPDRPHSTPTPP